MNSVHISYLKLSVISTAGIKATVLTTYTNNRYRENTNTYNHPKNTYRHLRTPTNTHKHLRTHLTPTDTSKHLPSPTYLRHRFPLEWVDHLRVVQGKHNRVIHRVARRGVQAASLQEPRAEYDVHVAHEEENVALGPVCCSHLSSRGGSWGFYLILFYLFAYFISFQLFIAITVRWCYY